MWSQNNAKKCLYCECWNAGGKIVFMVSAVPPPHFFFQLSLSKPCNGAVTRLSL